MDKLEWEIIKFQEGSNIYENFKYYFLNELSGSGLGTMNTFENLPVFSPVFCLFPNGVLSLTCVRPIIVNISLIFGGPHCKIIDKNAAWKLINWLTTSKKVTSLFCKKNALKKWKGKTHKN